MRKRRLRELADRLDALAATPRTESVPLGFNMRTYGPAAGYDDKSGHDCGTTCCIGGWAVQMWPKEVSVYQSTHHQACRILGLSDKVGRQLFCPGLSIQMAAGPRRAARVLRELADTGVVRW